MKKKSRTDDSDGQQRLLCEEEEGQEDLVPSVEAGEDGQVEEEVEEWGCDQVEEEVEAYMYLE